VTPGRTILLRGIVTGQADGRYGPGLPVRRDQMASFLVRATERRIGALLPRNGDFFTDDDDNTLRIDQAASAGFTGGATGGGYSPAALVRRDQMGSSWPSPGPARGAARRGTALGQVPPGLTGGFAPVRVRLQTFT
jgi:hypothetical protein